MAFASITVRLTLVWQVTTQTDPLPIGGFTPAWWVSFVKRVEKKDRKGLPSRRRAPIGKALGRVAAQVELSAEVVQGGGRSARLVEVRDRFMWEAVLEEGYRASEVAAFLGCHASNVSRASQKQLSQNRD